MLLKGLYIENSTTKSDIRIENGVFTEISSHIVPKTGEDVFDLSSKLALPPFIDSHIHLDTAMTVGEPDYNRSGTLFEGISLWAKRKQCLNYDDIKIRALKAIKIEVAHGVQFIRTHVDICDPSLTALYVLKDLQKELKGIIDLQIIGFPQEGILSFPNGKELMQKAIEVGVDGIGAIPHYEYTREYSVESINFIMSLAENHGLLVDVHCDETDDESSRGLETLAARAIEMKNGHRVTASHTTATGSYSDAYMNRLMRVLKKSEINFVSNPLVNMNLQGRFDSYPKRRGLTRIKEFVAGGLNVSFGQDDICDPWYPLGNGNLRDVVFMGLHAAQMTGYDSIKNSYNFITHNASRTLNICNYGIKIGNDANLIVLNADNYYNAIRDNSDVVLSIRRGKVIAQTTLANTATCL